MSWSPDHKFGKEICLQNIARDFVFWPTKIVACLFLLFNEIQIMAGNGEVRIKREFEEDPLSLELSKLLHTCVNLYYLVCFSLHIHIHFVRH